MPRLPDLWRQGRRVRPTYPPGPPVLAVWRLRVGAVVKRSTMRRQRSRPDPVTHEVAIAVFERDGGCVAPKIDPPKHEHTPTGYTVTGGAGDCRGRLTLDHVKDQPRMGKRAPSDPAHLVSICEWHHLYGWATSHRPEIREYLRGLG